MRRHLFIILAIVALAAVFVPGQTIQAATTTCHVVRAGETLTQIAQHYGVTVAALVKANGLSDPNLIYVGQCLRLPTTTPPPSSGCVKVHYVKAGEYLKLIAARYKVTVDAIVKANNLRNANLIYPGQRLNIPCTTTGTTPVTPTTGAWKGQYWNNRLLSGTPKFTRNSSEINFNWGTSGPGAGVSADNFSVRWARRQHFDAGRYRFHVQADDGVRVFLGNTAIIDQWHESSVTHYTADRQLAAGYQNLQIDYYEQTGLAQVKFWVERLDTPPPSNAWLAEYFGNRMYEPPALISRLEATIDYDWGKGPPIPEFRSDDFAVRWTRNVYFNEGDYRFTVTVDDGVEVLIDGKAIISEWHDTNGATYTEDVHITKGTHRVRVKYYEAGGFAKIKFGWAKATATPFTGEYFNNVKAQGTTVLVREDAAINFNWGSKSPAAGVTADYFSVEWGANIYFKAGTYRFTATADDGIRVFVDRMPVIDQWHDTSVRTYWVDVALTEGLHWIKVEYYERTGLAVAKLSWAKK